MITLTEEREHEISVRIKRKIVNKLAMRKFSIGQLNRIDAILDE